MISSLKKSENSPWECDMLTWVTRLKLAWENDIISFISGLTQQDLVQIGWSWYLQKQKICGYFVNDVTVPNKQQTSLFLEIWCKSCIKLAIKVYILGILCLKQLMWAKNKPYIIITCVLNLIDTLQKIFTVSVQRSCLWEYYCKKSRDRYMDDTTL